jgi:hypothetical protein
VPTINEVWEQAQQINANLVIIHDDLTGLSDCCGVTNQRLNTLVSRVEETNDWLEEVRQLVNDGFAAMSVGIAGIHARQDITNALLRYQIEQNNTIICALERISKNTCELLNHAARQTALQERIAADTAAQRHMFATAHPDAALALARESELRREIEACCPPEPPKPPCTYEPCARPGDVQQPRTPDFAGFRPRPTAVVRRREDR